MRCCLGGFLPLLSCGGPGGPPAACFCDACALLFAGRRSQDGYTPLHEAARHGYVFTAQLLLESNASVNATCNRNSTPLHLAIQFEHPEVVGTLVTGGGDIHLADNYGVSPCDMATSEAMMRALGTYKSVVILENTSAFVLKTIDRIEKESGLKIREGHQAVENARFRTLFNNQEFLVFIDRRKFADKRLAEVPPCVPPTNHAPLQHGLVWTPPVHSLTHQFPTYDFVTSDFKNHDLSSRFGNRTWKALTGRPSTSERTTTQQES